MEKVENKKCSYCKEENTYYEQSEYCIDCLTDLEYIQEIRGFE